MKLLCSVLALAAAAIATPVFWDGRLPLTYTEKDLDNSADPYLTVVKGSKNASYYTTLPKSQAPTPLWYKPGWIPLPIFATQIEQTINQHIDNTSVFVPGGNIANAQYGFRRGELLAQLNNNHTALVVDSEVGTNVYHVSIKLDPSAPLNYSHEYQIVFIEPNDGSHVFEIQLGSPFTNPNGPLPVSDAHSFKIRDHALNILFETPFTANTWHNFGIQVDFDHKTLGVLYSQNDDTLKAVTQIIPNLTTGDGVATGQGDFHVGFVKLPTGNVADVVHTGYQEAEREGLFYSGVFAEKITNGVSLGNGVVSTPFA